MTDLGRDLRASLAAVFRVGTPKSSAGNVVGRDDEVPAAARRRAADRIGLHSRHAGEHVLPLDAGRLRDEVRLLPDGQDGIIRNLTAGEIAGQVRVLVRELDMLQARFNIVLMGMGEPLHNYDAVMKALRILADEHGLAVNPRRVTLSTVGVLPALERLATEPLMPNLAISLHATTEEQRDLLVPINRKYGLKELLDACRRFPVKRRERITFEYVMLKDVNDTDEDARRLVRLLNGIKAKVNLLPLNEAAGFPTSVRRTRASTASRRSSPSAASPCRCASRAAATSAPLAAS
jgi:23S rRNA (adenine2503-C2)-methyltransferase